MLQPRIKAKAACPYGGQYKLENKAKGLVGIGTIFTQLVDSVKEYRRANGLPIGLGLEEEIEVETCLKYPDCCSDTHPGVPQSRRLTLEDVMHGTKLMVMHRMSGSPLVSEQEATRRAAICASCPYNGSFSKPCSTCDYMKDTVQAVIGSKATKYDDRLKSCLICGCYLSISVWVPLDMQLKVLSATQRYQFETAAQTVGCWKNPLMQGVSSVKEMQ